MIQTKRLFQHDFEAWMQEQIDEEKNRRRRELLEKGLSHGTMEFLRNIWYPVVGHFDHLYPEWEVRDFNSGYRYLDLAFMPPGGVKVDIEIHDYRTHARDLDTRRFKDLCRRQSLLALDDWVCFPIAYLSIVEEPEFCKQLALSLIGKYLTVRPDAELSCLEAEAVRYARTLLRPFSPAELAGHLRVTPRHARNVLHGLVEKEHLVVVGGKKRYRQYRLNIGKYVRNAGDSPANLPEKT